MSFKYKYWDDIKDITNCPPESCKCKRIEAFRFVFDETNEKAKNNFLPPLKINPKRILNTDSKRCSGHAISLFDSEENAKANYKKMLENNQNIHKSIGTHLAKGYIDENDGVVTDANNKGHFDFHP